MDSNLFPKNFAEKWPKYRKKVMPIRLFNGKLCFG
jgi:hypothetical protein